MLIRRNIGRSGLSVRWFDDWHDDLDAALAALPEMETCPHDLYREVILNRGQIEKRTALVSFRDRPVAVAGLKRQPSYWMPVTTWIAPGAVFPVEEGFLLPALEALEAPVFVAWWRQREPLPFREDAWEDVVKVPVHRLPCDDTAEAYWKQSGLWRHIRAARNKCKDMAVQVNRPDAAEWTIRNWGQKWAGDEDGEISDTGDRLLMARFWEPRGRHATVTLMLDDRFVASAAVFVHGNDIVGLANYREPEFDKLQTGTRLLDAVHHWATDAGYDKHDFGGGHDYKKRWAPEDGSRWQFTVNGHRKGLRALAKSARARIVAAIRS